MTDQKDESTNTVEKPSFMAKLTQVVNEECQAGTFAETIIGVMRRVEGRLLMAAEKATSEEQAAKLLAEKKAKEAKEQKDKEGSAAVIAPKGINT